MEAIILAGGLGTRLRSVVNDVPKCMAPIDNIPFIDFVVGWLKNEGVTRFIFSLGYKHDLLTEHLDKAFPQLEKIYSIEDEPLGTGGAIKKACQYSKDKNIIAVNGDTLFNINLQRIFESHVYKKPICTLALKHMKQFSRYGSVDIDADDYITAFREKQYCESGLINGGIYVIDTEALKNKTQDEKFSFEKDYLEKYVGEHQLMGIENDYYFIDIGIPEDYQRFKDDYRLILSKSKYRKNDGSPAFIYDILEGFVSLIID